MPELPDLQVFSHNLTKELKGKTVRDIDLSAKSKSNATKPELEKKLHGLKVKKIARVGKELHFIFDDETVLGLHLMLNGELHFFNHENKERNTIIAITFTDDTGIALTDYQAAATPTLNPEEKSTPDATEITPAYLKEKLSKTKTQIKKLLLDQHIIRGIGNAYADEICYHARLSPFSICNKIPEAIITKLSHSIKTVLEHAEKQILKSNPDIISGEVRDFLEIHNPRKTHSPTGGSIKQGTINSRKTYYTDEQELFN